MILRMNFVALRRQFIHFIFRIRSTVPQINNFIVNRLYNNPNIHVKINANQLFDSLDTSDLLQEAIRTLDLPINKILKLTKENFIRSFPSDFRQYADSTFSVLCDDIDELILKKLNILRFCKGYVTGLLRATKQIYILDRYFSVPS